MKRVLVFIGIITLVSGITWALKAQPKAASVPPKVYSVSLTMEQWNSVFNGLESIKNAVKLSNMPSVQATFIADSLIIQYQNEFDRQLRIQIAAEQQKAKDSTDKQKKK